MEFKDLVLDKVKTKYGDYIIAYDEFRGDLCITFSKDKIVELAQFLYNDSDLQFEVCRDVTAIDWATHKNRFTIVYHVYSLKNNFLLRIKTNLPSEVTSSVAGIWPSANWYERETFDMYGIKFENHPDLRRVYMPEEFKYHPLRKDFPVLGIPGSIPLPKK